mmetsp:Transcript_95794/g.298348  ORF Transcript_95794/g.298348 Transcript_95794/m.298348 type:complete len:220 (-) Transcript_95794:403-1062(-)
MTGEFASSGFRSSGLQSSLHPGHARRFAFSRILWNLLYFSTKASGIHCSTSPSVTLASQSSTPEHGHQSSVTRPSSMRMLMYIVMHWRQTLCAWRPHARGTTQRDAGKTSRQMLHRCMGTTEDEWLATCLCSVPDTARPSCEAQSTDVACVRSMRVCARMSNSSDGVVSLLPFRTEDTPRLGSVWHRLPGTVLRETGATANHLDAEATGKECHVAASSK